MNGTTIFNHSIRQVLGNLGMAIRVSGWFVAMVVLAVVFGSALLPEGFTGMMRQSPEEITTFLAQNSESMAGLMLAGFVFLVFVLWSASLIAIVWHRYILMEEVPSGLFPYRSGFRIGRYFWYSVGIALLAVLVGGVLGAVLGLVFAPLAMAVGSGGSLIVILVAAVVGIIITVLYLRMALVLPSVALEDGLTLGHAWQDSKGFSGAIAMLAVMLTLLNTVAGFVLEMLPGIGLPYLLVSLLNIAFTWFYFMLNISILSTLYGYIVQKREIY